ncbi:MAG: YbhB/YbcL family Raf kinase inhibitor-like protein [Candidatus Eremiobacterota bacterium]
MQIVSCDIDPGQAIPILHTGDGRDLSPALGWSRVPPGARELVLICDDPDAPTAEPFVHWVLYGLPPDCTWLPRGLAPQERLEEPPGALQGRNSFRSIGYRGPAPPVGHGVHHYHFRLYALDEPTGLPPGATRADLVKAMQGHVLAQAELVGTYERPRGKVGTRP